MDTVPTTSSDAPRTSTGSLGTGLPCNLRDLGGLPLIGGGYTRHNVVVRSDDLTRADPQTATEVITTRGIREIIDLRSHNELARLGRAGTCELPVHHHHLPMQLGPRHRTGPPPALPTTPAELGLLYASTVEHAALPLRFAFEVVADSHTCVLFHCVAGKDRAGLLAALLLTAVGVERHAIVVDYVRTRDNLAQLQASVLGPDGGVAGATGIAPVDSLPPVLLQAPAQALEVCLDTLTARHGAPLVPLYEIGLDEAVITRLRARMVGP